MFVWTGDRSVPHINLLLPCYILFCNYLKDPLSPGLYLMIVNNHKRIIVPNDDLNSAHPIAVAKQNYNQRTKCKLFYY